jgi:hypothetical protein
MDLTQQLVTTLQPAFLTLIEGVVAVAVPTILFHFNAWMKARSHDARFHCAMDKVTHHAEAAVLDTFQTYTKAVARTGSWGDEAAGEAKRRGLEKLRKLLGGSGLKELQGCLGHDEEGVAGILESGLEAAVNRLKADGRLKFKKPMSVPDGDGTPPSEQSDSPTGETDAPADS